MEDVKMRILIFIWRDIKNPKAGGSEIFFHEISKGLVKEGHSVMWIVGGWKGCRKEEVVEGVHVVRVGRELSLYALAPFAYLRKKKYFDVIVDVDNGLPFFTPLFVLNKKRFYHIHHIHEEVWKKEAEGKGIKERFIANIGYLLERFIVPLIYRKEKVVTISKSSAHEIRQKKIGREVVGIVNPGIKIFRDNKFVRKSRKPSILFLNRIKSYKGIKTLLDSLKILEKDGINPETWIGGGGDDLEKMKSYARELHLGKVLFLGRVSEEEKVEFMKKAWVFVNPSFKEGWGIVNIEANSLGTVVIGSNVGGIKDSVIDKKTGLLFEYGNPRDLAEKLQRMLKNKNLREKMEIEGKKWAKNFSWDRAIKEYERILKQTN